MSREVEFELLRASREMQVRFVYFLLAGAAAAIGFGLTQTQGQALSIFHLPLAFALVSWGTSFWFGCRFARSSDVMLGLNLERVRLQSGVDPLALRDPEQAAQRLAASKAAFEKRQKQGTHEARWQYRLLLAGAVLFGLWRVLEMGRVAAAN